MILPVFFLKVYIEKIQVKSLQNNSTCIFSKSFLKVYIEKIQVKSLQNYSTCIF